MKYKYTSEDIEFLKKYYPIGDWNKIYERFPKLTNTAIYKKMQKSGIKSDNLHRKTFNNSITRRNWTEEEKKIVFENYENIEMKELLLLLPDRSVSSINSFARRHNLISYNYKNRIIWKIEEINYIKDNWELLPDKLIADDLKRTFRAVKAKREELDLYRQDMSSISYPTLSKYLRGQNHEWKKSSMRSCNYQCILTGSKNFEIHHLYGVSNIITDIMNKYNSYKDKKFSEYNENDLSFILQKFLKEQSKYPLGECVDKKIHTLFHSMYDQYYNTPEQWYKFKQDYLEGKYIKYA